MKNHKILFLDMDGTIADLYSYPDWAGVLRGHVGNPWVECNPQDPEEVYEMFTNLKPMISQEELIQYCLDLADDIVVFTMTPWGATPECVRATIDAKNDWLDKNYPLLKNRIITTYGHVKDMEAVMRAGWLDLPDISSERILPHTGDILVDDSETLRENWTYGPAIVPPWIERPL